MTSGWIGYLLTALVAFATSFLLSSRFSSPASRLYILDQPGERSLHASPIPRTGGVAILGGGLTGILVHAYCYGAPDSVSSWILASVAIIFLVSLIDDIWGLAPLLRLLIHVIAAFGVIFGGLQLVDVGLGEKSYPLPFPLSTAVTCFFVVWLVNLYNFMDGMDGFAAGMAAIGFGVFAYVGFASGQVAFAATGFVIASSVGGFLVLNFPPARIFMGDAGSSTLGLMAAAMILWANQLGMFSIWLGMLVFSPFVVDATVTLAGRILRRERIWLPHKNHYYQQLVASGWGHTRTVSYAYVLMAMSAGSALVAMRAPAAIQAAILLAWLGLYALLVLLISQKTRSTTKNMADQE